MAEGTTNKNVDYLDTSTSLSTGGFQYTNETRDFFPTIEGYVKAVVLDAGGYSYHYVYNYTDHLGNIRLKYTAHPQTGEIQPLEETEKRGSRTPFKNKQGREQSHYYPFGLTHDGYQPNHKIIGFEGPGSNITIIPTSPNVGDPYKYKYQGQERQDEFNLNWDSFKWRNYDYTIGRFMSIYPLAENMLIKVYINLY